MDSLKILNYQGSKKNLIPFIHRQVASDILPNHTILDIFSGTCSVGYSFKRTNRVYANDCERYAFVIAQALLGNYFNDSHKGLLTKTKQLFDKNHKLVLRRYKDIIDDESLVLNKSNSNEAAEFYSTIPTIWNGGVDTCGTEFDLFLRYYPNSYFGTLQAAEIDSIRFAVEELRHTGLYAPMMAALYFAMKECVFAKDGHMAQPLDIKKNFSKLLRVRKRSIFELFISKLEEFFSESFVLSPHDNKAFNMNFIDLLDLPEIRQDVDVIYADPPYTDMQYSRYYHILNFATYYKPLSPTFINGTHTKGLYTEERYQSNLSTKGKSLKTFTALIDFSRAYKKDLIISFAYPANVVEQKTDRYVMTISSLIDSCKSSFGKKNVKVHSCEYSHSNNRNSKQKEVLEYLIVCKSF